MYGVLTFFRLPSIPVDLDFLLSMYGVLTSLYFLVYGVDLVYIDILLSMYGVLTFVT